MGALANRKHELFAQALAKGEPACQAYVSAGYAYNEGNAVRLKGNEKVAARIDELIERAAVKCELSIADIVEMLCEDRDLARREAQSGSAVSASMGIASLLGHLKDRVESTVNVKIDRSDEIEAEYQEIFANGPTPHLIEVQANG